MTGKEKIGIALWAFITAAVTVMNVTRFSFRLELFPALLLLIPWFADRTFTVSTLFTPNKNGLRTFLWFAGAIILFYPPLYFGWMITVEHRIWSAPESSEVFKALQKGLLLLLVAGIPEEVFFRGYLQHSVFKKRDTFVIPLISQRNLIVSLLFATTHAIAFLNPMRLNVFFPSLLFGYLVEKSKGSLFYAIAMHILSNFIAMFLITFF